MKVRMIKAMMVALTAGMMFTAVPGAYASDYVPSPVVIITPIGETNSEFTESDLDTDIPDVIGTVHVKPLDGTEDVTLNVPGVKKGDEVIIYEYLPDGYYIELEGEVIDDDTVRVVIDEEGDIIITLGEDDDDEYIITPDTETPTPTPTPEITEPPSITPPPRDDITPTPQPHDPESPQTDDNRVNPAVPAGLCGLSALCAVYLVVKKRKEVK